MFAQFVQSLLATIHVYFVYWEIWSGSNNHVYTKTDSHKWVTPILKPT